MSTPLHRLPSGASRLPDPRAEIGGFYRYLAAQHRAGCELSDGSMNVCNPCSTFSPDSPGCVNASQPIPCVHANKSSRSRNRTLCQVLDGREGNCLDGVRGGEHFCKGIVCAWPDNICRSDHFCN